MLTAPQPSHAIELLSSYDTPRYHAAEAFLVDQLSALGIRIEVGTDMQVFPQILNAHLPQRLVTQPFCAGSVFQDQPGIWIVGWDRNDRLVHTQATRVICPDTLPFAAYFQRNFQHFPPPGLPIDFERSELDLNPGLKALRGRVCYHGEVWLHDSPLYRGGKAIGLTGALNFVAAMRRLRVDAFVGLMVKALGDKGLPNRQGYIHASPDCLTWHRLDGAPAIRTYMVHQTKGEVDFLLSKLVR